MVERVLKRSDWVVEVGHEPVEDRLCEPLEDPVLRSDDVLSVEVKPSAVHDL